jgi:hypothetical protein
MPQLDACAGAAKEKTIPARMAADIPSVDVLTAAAPQILGGTNISET